jgi:hypothetical protein
LRSGARGVGGREAVARDLPVRAQLLEQEQFLLPSAAFSPVAWTFTVPEEFVRAMTHSGASWRTSSILNTTLNSMARNTAA